MPLDLLDLQGNEGLVAAAAAPVPDALLSQVQQAMQRRLGRGVGWVRFVLVIPQVEVNSGEIFPKLSLVQGQES